MRLKSATTLAGILLAMSGASALARPAVTTYDSNLRSGPGVENAVVGVIPAGAAIDVGKCTGSWCRVRADGGSGYLSRSLIAFGGAPRSGGAVAATGSGAIIDGSSGYPDAYGYNNNYAYGDSGYYGPDAAYNDYDGGPAVGLGFYGGSGWNGDQGRFVGGRRFGERRGGGNGFGPGRSPVAVDRGPRAPTSSASFQNGRPNGMTQHFGGARMGGFHGGGMHSTSVTAAPSGGRGNFQGGMHGGGGMRGGGGMHGAGGFHGVGGPGGGDHKR